MDHNKLAKLASDLMRRHKQSTDTIESLLLSILVKHECLSMIPLLISEYGYGKATKKFPHRCGELVSQWYLDGGWDFLHPKEDRELYFKRFGKSKPKPSVTKILQTYCRGYHR